MLKNSNFFDPKMFIVWYYYVYYSDHSTNLCQQKCFFVLTTHSQIVAKVGLMHLIATNACIVIRTLVKESSKEMAHGRDGSNPNMFEFGFFQGSTGLKLEHKVLGSLNFAFLSRVWPLFCWTLPNLLPSSGVSMYVLVK